MTTAQAHEIATASPVRTITTRLGELKEEADRQILNLAATLKQIDQTRDVLNEHGLQMVVDLGEIGNAAAVARRQVDGVKDARTFAMPRVA